MNSLVKYITKELESLKEAKILKKYPIPPNIKDALENKLKMRPLVRFVNNLKALNSIPPAYRIFLLNGKYFDLYLQDYSLMAKIENEEYYLADLDERNYAVKHINRLLTKPILKKGDDEDTSPPPLDSPGGEPEEKSDTDDGL